MSTIKPFPILLIMALIWTAIVNIQTKIDSSEVMALDYSPGQQEVFPLFVPDYEPTPNEYFNVLDNEANSSSENIYWFGRDWLGLSPAGSSLLVRTLQSVSEGNPVHRDDAVANQTSFGEPRCGVAGWVCNGDRFNNLISFANARRFAVSDLKTQMLYVGFEMRQDFSVLEWSTNIKAGQKSETLTLLKQIGSLDEITDESSGRIIKSWFDQETISSDQISQIRAGSEEVLNSFEPPPEEESPETETPTTNPPNNEVRPPVEKKPTRQPKSPVLIKPPLTSINHNCPNPVRNYKNATKYISQQTRVKVHGLPKLKVTVHNCLAKSVEMLFKEMNTYLVSKGLNSVGGWGWRSVSQQIHLRQKHNCPNIYTSPPSDCDILVALPGRSFHNYGLAVDFFETNSKGSPTHGLTRRSPAYKWLKSNASRFGLLPLDPEPWHWSTRGG